MASNLSSLIATTNVNADVILAVASLLTPIVALTLPVLVILAVPLATLTVLAVNVLTVANCARNVLCATLTEITKPAA